MVAPTRVAVALVGAILLHGCSAGIEPRPEATSAPSPPSPRSRRSGDVRVALERVAAGLDHPLLVTHAGDGSGRLFVVEQGGAIRVAAGAARATPYLDLSDLTDAAGERGLLGLAFHPRFGANGRLFVDYTDAAGDTVVAEYRADPPDAPAVDADTARVLLRVDQPFANHNGGHLAFGPDGYLYVGLGDGGGAGDPLDAGQRLDTLLGKLLRIDVDRGRRYAIPPDNPFRGRSGARAEIWAYGLRNPWRFSFDRATGDLWLGDVGQGAAEEIDHARAGASGLNYGWNVMEGDRCFEPGCDAVGLVAPVVSYGRDDGCSVVGGYVYRGTRFPALTGTYLYADYCSGKIWGLATAAPERRRPVLLRDTAMSISSLGEDEEGEVYVTDLAGGNVWRITATR